MCMPVIFEAEYMEAASAVPVRQPVKQPAFGALAFGFSEEDCVQKVQAQFVDHQGRGEGRGNAEGMQAATEQFFDHLEKSFYFQ